MSATMRAVWQDGYGPIEALRVREVPRPVAGPGEVLVRVHAASVHADVWHAVEGFPFVMRLMGFGFAKPSHPIPGIDMAGVVQAAGPGVTRFAPGEAVFGETQMALQWQNGGAFAEYVVAPVEALAAKPASVSFEQAAGVPTSGYIAWMNLKGPGQLRAGQRVLINGAAGGVGSMALQIAKAEGARVTAVDAGPKLVLLRRLGADVVLDHTQHDVTQLDAAFDLVFDVASTLPYARCKRLLNERGLYVRIGHDHYGTVGRRLFGSMPAMFGLMARATWDAHLPRPSFQVPPKREVMEGLAKLLAAGKLTPVVDRTFPLEQVCEALAYLKSGQPCGKILLLP